MQAFLSLANHSKALSPIIHSSCPYMFEDLNILGFYVVLPVKYEGRTESHEQQFFVK